MSDSSRDDFPDLPKMPDYTDGYKAFDLGPGQIAQMDQFDSTIYNVIDTVVADFKKIIDSGMGVPPSVTAVGLCTNLGLDCTDMQDPFVRLVYIYVYMIEMMANR